MNPADFVLEKWYEYADLKFQDIPGHSRNFQDSGHQT